MARPTEAAKPRDTAWRPQEVEQEMYQAWEKAGLFTADPGDPRPHFCIVLPPPNITGELHMGHAEYTLQDLYCRYQRMRGFEVLWLPGTDHAAIATNAVIQKQLLAEGTTREEIGRAAFDRRVERWYEQYGARILDQLRRLGFCLDWTRLRFTMDPEYVRAVREAFVRLYEEGLIYRGPRIVNWCPNCHSSVSDLEVDWKEHEDTLYFVRYDMVDGDGALVVATVRPETMLADTGVAVNPEDERYRAFVGREARLPLVGRQLPVVADDQVKMDFGTGALKVTPGHDPADYEIGQRHHLEIVTCIDKDGNIVGDDWVPDELRTRDWLTARERVVEMLRERDHLVRTEAYRHEVGHCNRCDEVIQPLVDDQWWCSMESLAAPAIKVVEEGTIKFVPERYAKQYLEWMRNLRDWNVSRQIWLGHRIPIYSCDQEHVFASVEEPVQCPRCQSAKLRQDPDVLDTWFSSALWPFATMGWPGGGEDLEAFHPTDILDTGRDIIYLWVARMIMMDLHFLGAIPFRTVLIHATIQDEKGRRMSKSLGTGVDPLDMINQYGADAVRAWCAEVGVGRQDVPLHKFRMEAYQRFANKLWQMSRLVVPKAEGVALRPVDAGYAAEATFDRWILSRLDGLTAQVTDALEGYDPGDAIIAIYEFAWHEFADWYLELAKPRFALSETEPARVEAVSVAVHVLGVIVRLLHPFMPFVTEAVWQRLPGERRPMIARAPEALWPSAQGRGDPELEAAVAGLFELVTELRDALQAAGLRSREKARLQLQAVGTGPATALALSQEGRAAIELLVPAELADLDGAAAHTVVAQGLEVRLAAPHRSESGPAPTDSVALERELEATRASIKALERQLANQQFVERAKPQVVQQARDRMRAARERLGILEEALARA